MPCVSLLGHMSAPDALMDWLCERVPHAYVRTTRVRTRPCPQGRVRAVANGTRSSSSSSGSLLVLVRYE
eukprot:scaffold43702_cov14-Prasinocladus_malaysianus.AAC.1